MSDFLLHVCVSPPEVQVYSYFIIYVFFYKSVEGLACWFCVYPAMCVWLA